MTPDIPALEAICERLEQGESLWFDIRSTEVMAAVGFEVRPWGRRSPRYREPVTESWGAVPMLHLLDDCEALRKRLLPGWCTGPNFDSAAGTFHAELGTESGDIRVEADAPTEPAARLCAILRAYIAVSNQEG